MPQMFGILSHQVKPRWWKDIVLKTQVIDFRSALSTCEDSISSTRFIRARARDEKVLSAEEVTAAFPAG
jgi:hypothetical protein